MSHAPDRPIWVRLKGISPDNAQHRFYSHAGRYTGVFWPLNEDQVRKGLDAIEVVSVEAFRKLARVRGDFIEIGEVGEGGPGPRPGRIAACRRRSRSRNDEDGDRATMLTDH